MSVATDAERDPARTATSAIDPVTVEVIRRRLVAISDEVDVNITRTAFSPYIYEYKDYAVGIVDADGDLICQCTAGMPVFVADVMRAAVCDGLELYGKDKLLDGDIVVTNYAGTIGQHLNNVTMYTPIYAPQRPELIGFMVVVMHWIDVGGRDVGSLSKFATDIFQEGIQFRTVKLQSRGEPVSEMYRMIEHNTRFPVEMMGDINSQIGGCLLGRDSVVELVDRYGIETFLGALGSDLGSIRSGQPCRDFRYSGWDLHRRSNARQRRAQSRRANLQSEGRRRRRRDDNRSVRASAGSQSAYERRPQRRRLDRGATCFPLFAAPRGRCERRHFPSAQADLAGRHHRQRTADVARWGRTIRRCRC